MNSVQTIVLYLFFLRSMHWLLAMANAVPSSLVLVTLMMEALCSSETSVLTRATQRNISECGILQLQISWKTDEALPCLLTCPVAVFLLLVMMVISRLSTVTSVADNTENTRFRFLLRSC
jgi:hypothetical protein